MIKVNEYVDYTLKEWCKRNLHAPVVPIDWYNPKSLKELREDRRSNKSEVYVFAHGSKNTIFNYDETKWYYRAWHDSMHMKHNLEVGGDDEITLAKIQEQELIKLGVTPWDAYLITMDLILHITHYEKYKIHPEYQGDMLAWFLINRNAEVTEVPNFGFRVY